MNVWKTNKLKKENTVWNGKRLSKESEGWTSKLLNEFMNKCIL